MTSSHLIAIADFLSLDYQRNTRIEIANTSTNNQSEQRCLKDGMRKIQQRVLLRS